jgi:hypothetical protein
MTGGFPRGLGYDSQGHNPRHAKCLFILFLFFEHLQDIFEFLTTRAAFFPLNKNRWSGIIL